MDRRTSKRAAAEAAAVALAAKNQRPTKKKKQVPTTTTTTITKQTPSETEDNCRPRRKAFVDATANMKPQPKQLPNTKSSKTKTKTTKSSKTKSLLPTKPSPPAFTNYPAAILIAINSLKQKHAIKNSEKNCHGETSEMKLLEPFSLIIKLHIMMNMPDGMSYEDDKFQDALSHLLLQGDIEVNNCIYSVVDGKSKDSSEISAEMNDRFGLRALTFGDDPLPTGINYTNVPFEILTRVHHDASVPDAPIVGDDGLAETHNENILLTWHMAQIVEKVMDILKWDVDKLMNEIGVTPSESGTKCIRAFLRMAKFPTTGVATNAGSRKISDPTTAFQESPWYKTLVGKMATSINGMDDKDKKDCLSCKFVLCVLYHLYH